MKKTIYRHLLTVEVLSEEPLDPSMSWSLRDIACEIYDGSFSGATTWTTVNEPLTGKVAVKTILAQGSDPEFFRMDNDGNEIED